MGEAMNAKVVACANMKGGVGKSTVALSFAEGTAHLGQGRLRVLVIDTDLQLNASTILVRDLDGGEPWRQGKTVEDYLRQRAAGQCPKAMSLVHYVDENVQLLSAKLTLVNFERSLLSRDRPTTMVRNDISAWFGECLSQLREHYQLIIVDTPPGLSLLAECALQLADLVVIPTVPNRLSSAGIETYAKYITDELGLVDVGTKSTVLINMKPTPATRTSEKWIEQIKAEAGADSFPYKLFDTQYGMRDGYRRGTEIERPANFQRAWGTVADPILAATRELWSFLDAPLHQRG
ncbi:MAG: AAA family ATPase [Hyphomicrobiaceae bacterium]|nr:AAA family ATPase [Hyphomicrobiaceae bacterium]